MTLRGAEKLREELDFLKSVRRPEIIAAIADAREHGDLKRSEYRTLVNQQGFVKVALRISKRTVECAGYRYPKMPNNGQVILVLRSTF